MSREIKFRAWDFAIKEMSKPCDLYGIQRNFPPLIEGYSGGDFVFMQYTGLKDKNGIEVFEGDVIDLVGDGSILSVVVWNEKTAAFAGKDVRNDNIKDISDHLYGTHLATVIGNIYENPELIKQ